MRKKSLPSFFTDLHGDYHRATDDIEKINLAADESRDFAYRLANAMTRSPQP